MPTASKPVEDTVAKINNDLAVGEDLVFQRRWWKFERIIWPLFFVIILLDVAGALGRGPLAKAEASSEDGTLHVKYERLERYGTPSLLNVSFGAKAIQDQKLQLWVSEKLVKDLGNQRVVPAPASSTIGQDGILYTFPAADQQASIAFALEPAKPGLHHLELRLPRTGSTARLTIFVFP